MLSVKLEDFRKEEVEVELAGKGQAEDVARGRGVTCNVHNQFRR